MFPVVFVMTDVIGEVYGKQIARLFVLAGFVATALFAAYSFLALSLPWSNAVEWIQGSFWLRSNLSNLWSQLLDTTLFMTIAFLGVYPIDVLLKMVVAWWLFKVAMGVLYTPLAYAGIYLLKRKGE